MGLEDLGKFHLEAGNIKEARAAFTRMRSESTEHRQIEEVERLHVEVLVEEKNWLGILGGPRFASPISTGSAGDPLIPRGLASLRQRNYSEAARNFTMAEGPTERRDNAGPANSSGGGGTAKWPYSHLLSVSDVAVYGGLTALATMDRGDLQSAVLDNSNFRLYLEHEPHVRRAIQFFVNARYAECLGVLHSHRVEYLLDLHLHHHVEELLYMIRTECIVRYFQPFSCVSIEALEKAFGVPGQSIEGDLLRMIHRGDLLARINKIDKVCLYQSSVANFRA